VFYHVCLCIRMFIMGRAFRFEQIGLGV
jgi:hypothetical protein